MAGVTRCYIKKYEITTILALNYVISIGYRDSQHKGQSLNCELNFPLFTIQGFPIDKGPIDSCHTAISFASIHLDQGLALYLNHSIYSPLRMRAVPGTQPAGAVDYGHSGSIEKNYMIQNKCLCLLCRAALSTDFYRSAK